MPLIDHVTTRAPQLPSRIFFYAAEKWGKTSFACFAPKPIFIMTQGETGLLTLLESGQVPETAHFPQACETWSDLQLCTRSVLTDKHDFQTLVIDTSNGAERLLASQVLEQEFNGQHGGKMGYGSYGKGDQACIPHWMQYLRLLDEIRTRRKMHIILLAHSRIKSVNNPEGDDYDQLRPEGIDKLWTLTHKWADVIAAGTLKIAVKDDKVQGSVTQRIIRTSSTPAVVAGNRYGLPAVIDCGNGAHAAWSNFKAAMTKARAVSAGQPTQQPASNGQPQPQA